MARTKQTARKQSDCKRVVMRQTRAQQIAAGTWQGPPATALLEVPVGTVEIEARAYADRTDITMVRIPASVKSIGLGAFAG